jgi:hypothetical protein
MGYFYIPYFFYGFILPSEIKRCILNTSFKPV